MSSVCLCRMVGKFQKVEEVQMGKKNVSRREGAQALLFANGTHVSREMRLHVFDLSKNRTFLVTQT